MAPVHTVFPSNLAFVREWFGFELEVQDFQILSVVLRSNSRSEDLMSLDVREDGIRI